VKGPTLSSNIIVTVNDIVMCNRLPRSHPNTSTSQYDAEVKIEEELSNEKRTARMKKVMQLCIARCMTIAG